MATFRNEPHYNEKSPTEPLSWGTLMRSMLTDLAFQRGLYLINGNHLFFERVGASFRRFNGLDDFSERLTIVFRFQGCNYLFSHDFISLQFPVYSCG